MQLVQFIVDDVRSFGALLSFCYCEVRHLLGIETLALRIVRTLFVVVACILYLLIQCSLSNSLTLTVFTHLLIFDMLSLVVGLVSLWTKHNKANLYAYTFGYQRFEVVAVFASSILCILLSFFEIKESVERLFEPDEIFPHQMIVPCLLAFVLHLFVVYGVNNAALAHVIQACGSSWIQEHTTDICRTICRFVPGLSRFLLPRLNPIGLIGFISSTTVCIIYFIMIAQPQTSADLNFADPLPDTLGAIIISLMLFGTMTPMTLYSGRILLQTIPAHLIGSLDKALRESSTVDGVLELQKEHIWSVGFQDLAASLYVRVRRDADEQMVLARITNRLCGMVKHLTVQVYKDDWTRTASTYTMDWSHPINHQNHHHHHGQTSSVPLVAVSESKI